LGGEEGEKALKLLLDVAGLNLALPTLEEDSANGENALDQVRKSLEARIFPSFHFFFVSQQSRLKNRD
jgi:hypothetical protein